MYVTNERELCTYSTRWVIDILQHHIVFVEQYIICFRLSVFLNYSSIFSPHTVTPTDQEWNVFLKESLWYSLSVSRDLSGFSDRQTYIRCKRVPVPIPIKCELRFNPLNTELNPICHLLALLRAHHILHVSKIRVNILLICIGSCIVIYSYCTTKKMHLLSQIIYSCKTLYIFRKVLPSIIRSSKLRIQQQA
jgi:hypothetical protein